MKLLNKISIFSIIVLFFMMLTAANDKELFEINKSFDIYGAVIKELNEKYVVDLKTAELMKNGIDGMLKNLDPYTIYYEEDNTESIDIITRGQYVGFGITISRFDGKVTIVDISTNSNAKKDGLRIGDIIYKIDTTVVENMLNDELKNYTQGVVNSKVNVKILRGIEKDTVDLLLQRKNVKVVNVTYTGIIKDSIGLIKLERFSKNASIEFKNSLTKLLKNKVKGIIIDLRDNPGGLLRSAVKICEYFLPKNSLIVTTKGKNNKNKDIYKSRYEPIAPNIPLTILINESSASASEIVAGALQDHDRAVVLGNESFGKGLVQTVVNLPYNTNLKITTAKYFTPSGRSIQRIDYNKNNKNSKLNTNNNDIRKDSLIFHSVSGRKLFAKHGITPDSIVGITKRNKVINELISINAFFMFANYFTNNKIDIDLNWRPEDNLIDSFIQFLESEKYLEKLKSHRNISDLNEKNNFSDNNKISDLIDKLIIEINNQNKKIIRNNKKDCLIILKNNILKRFYYSSEILALNIIDDKLVNQAISLINSNVHKNILSNVNKNKVKNEIKN